MAKIFRLHIGKNDLVNWGKSNKYGSDVINQIKDPDGATSKKEITSIPSPFARIDLVKTAYKSISEEKNLDGDTIYHKMVSDSLDVGEIFFNVDKLRDKIQLFTWDKTDDLEALETSPNPSHRTLGETIRMYLEQDAEAYNFNKLKRIYLLNYIGSDKPAQLNIIGATSPVTLFFSSANNLEYVSKNIRFGQDRPFDSTLQPLYKRDPEYQRYLYAFRIAYGKGEFATDFPEFNDYLDVNYSKLSNKQQTMIDALTNNSIDDYEQLEVNSATNYVEVLGQPLRKKSSVVSLDNSDFEIISDRYKGIQPLVLPIETGNTYTKFRYTQDNWSKNDKAPVYDSSPLEKRTLPNDNAQYPYLTISDFIEDAIIRMPYELNAKSFFNGNIARNKENSYLLPLTNLFFEFFNLDDLHGETKGKKFIELNENAGGVSITLRIPVKGGCIEYNRTYFNNNEPNLSKNEGAIIDKEFGLGLLPAVKFKSEKNNHYRIALFDKGNLALSVKCYDKTKLIETKGIIIRRLKGDVCGVETLIIDQKFDRIAVTVGGVHGVILPEFILPEEEIQFTFAVDFGTTNTHIEYSTNGSPSKPLHISKEEKQIQRLHLDYKQDRDIENAFDDNFIPATISDGDTYSFPMRTVFAEHHGIDYAQPTYTLASGNIPFRYEKGWIPPHNKIRTDLKWSVKEQDRVRLFLENLFFMMSNKVLLNKGKLDSTKIVWFYPASMTEAHCNKFKRIWNELYREYFGDHAENIIMMSESIAPYHYYHRKGGAKSNVVTIDIGGGTTDVYVVENYEPKMLSSFRFAANAIFGDGYNYDSENNGFVKAFKDEMVSTMSANNLSELLKAFETIESGKTSSDITSFFFSLADNKQIKSKDIRSLDFLQKLTDNDQFKYVFILFYTAILYFVAKSMKAKGLEMPLTIAFSGNGSKTLKILSSDNHTITRFVKIIFETIYNSKYDTTNDLEVKYEENPKEATCKGGIETPQAQDFDEIDTIKCALLGSDDHTFVERQSYNIIGKDIQKEITDQTKLLIEFMLDLNKNNDSFFIKKFGADAKIGEKIKDICLRNIDEYMKLGLLRKQEEIELLGSDNIIEETLFFYPIVGVLNNLAREISKL